MAFVPLNTNNSNLANYNSVNSLMLDYQGFKKTVGTSSAEGWVSGVLPSVSSVAYNGNRSYDITFAGPVDSYLSLGMRLKTVRQVAAPTQCTSLNGTTQYFNRASASINGMTFTDDFVVSAWVKLSSYAAAGGGIVGRYNGTNGWLIQILSTGQVAMYGFNGGSNNTSLVTSYQSIPLNKWVHITAQLDMSAFTATTTTSYIMIDGVDVPAIVNRAGTNPTSLVQGTGNLEIGSYNGGTIPFNGKIAQVAIFSAKVTQATIRGYYSQGLAGTETNLISAYSFNGTANDLNTTNANNLTAQGSAAATNADSPFSVNGSGTATGTDDFGIVQAVSSTVATVSLPAGCTIPTSGGVAATYTSTQKNPFNWVTDKDRWEVLTRFRSIYSVIPPVINTWYNVGNLQLNVPKGVWDLRHVNNVYGSIGSANVIKLLTTLSTSTSAESDRRYTFDTEFGNLVAASGVTDHTETVNLTAATIYYGIIRCEVTTLGSLYFLGDRADVSIRALPSGL